MKHKGGLAIILALLLTMVGAFSVTTFAEETWPEHNFPENAEFSDGLGLYVSSECTNPDCEDIVEFGLKSDAVKYTGKAIKLDESDFGAISYRNNYNFKDILNEPYIQRTTADVIFVDEDGTKIEAVDVGTYDAEVTITYHGNPRTFVAKDFLTIEPLKIEVAWSGIDGDEDVTNDSCVYDSREHGKEMWLQEGEDLDDLADGQRLITYDRETKAGDYKMSWDIVDEDDNSVRSNYDWKKVGDGTRFFTIEKKHLTVAGISFDKVYDGSSDISYTGTPQFEEKIPRRDKVFIDGNGITGSYLNDEFEKDANAGEKQLISSDGLDGSVVIKLAGADSDNYEASLKADTAKIQPKPIKVTGIKAKDKDYDGTTKVDFDYEGMSVDTLLDADVDKVKITASGEFADKNAGDNKNIKDFKINIGGEAGGNYVLASSGNQTKASATIRKLDITVVRGITAANKTYNGNDIATIQLDNARFDKVLRNERRDVRINNVTGKFEQSDVKIDEETKNVVGMQVLLDYGSATLSGGASANYKLVVTEGTQKYATATINQINVGKLVWGDTKFTYNGQEQAPTATVNPSKLVGEDKVNVTVSGAKDANTADNPTHTAIATGLDNTNYKLSGNPSNSTIKFTIDPLVATLSWSPSSFTYNGQAQAPTATVTNLQPELVGAVKDVCEVNGTVITGSKVTTDGKAIDVADDYKIKATSLSNTNYKLDTTSPEEFAFAIVSSGGTPGGGGGVTDPVKHVQDLINALPDADKITDADAAKVKEAQDAYDALTNEQKDQVGAQLVDKLNKCTEAVKSEEQKKADQKAADEASALITKLPDDPSQASEADAMAAYNAYMALTDAQKALLSPAAQEKVAEYAYYYEAQYAAAQKVNKFKVKNVKTRKAKATWKKTAGISGYQLTYKAKGTKTKKVTVKASAVKKVVKKLKKGKKYTFKIRTFTKVYNPYTGSYEKVYGKWAKKTVKIKK